MTSRMRGCSLHQHQQESRTTSWLSRRAVTRLALAGQVATTTLFWSVLPGVVDAYDRDGHEAIGMTAMSAITGGKVLQTLKRLLRGKDAMDVAGWAHIVDDKYPWVHAFHFQRYRLDPAKYPNYEQQCENLEIVTTGPDCENNLCLVQILKHFYGSLVFGKESSKTVKATFPDPSVTFTDADAVKFLINLVGDMHQPLHFIPQGPQSPPGPINDKSKVAGQNIAITVPGKGKTPGEPAKTNLYF